MLLARPQGLGLGLCSQEVEVALLQLLLHTKASSQLCIGWTLIAG
jgi:hypothetical protein